MQFSQFLPVIRNRSYYVHPENILILMNSPSSLLPGGHLFIVPSELLFVISQFTCYHRYYHFVLRWLQNNIYNYIKPINVILTNKWINKWIKINTYVNLQDETYNNHLTKFTVSPLAEQTIISYIFEEPGSHCKEFILVLRISKNSFPQENLMTLKQEKQLSGVVL